VHVERANSSGATTPSGLASSSGLARDHKDNAMSSLKLKVITGRPQGCPACVLGGFARALYNDVTFLKLLLCSV
jgi:hypothetical protein